MSKKKLQKNLLEWYQKKHRDLPWRKTKDPYKIWLSEIMLQQTQVSTVIPYYERWVQELSTIQSVANASESKILKLWEGLGYYSRARNFQRACQEVVSNYHSQLPDTVETIQKLPGIGRYTAGAIISIAYNKPVPLVDGNVVRVLSRIYALEKDPKKEINAFWQIAQTIVPKNNPGDFNQALMELGATLCTPTKPSCLLCPVASLCQASQKNLQEKLPIKPARPEVIKINLASALIQNKGRIFLCQRKGTGHLNGMWELPTIPFTQKKEAKSKLVDFLGKGNIGVKLIGEPTRLQTSRTNHRLHFHIFSSTLLKNNRVKTNHQNPPTTRLGYPTNLNNGEWVSITDLKKLPLPGVLKKYLPKILNL